MLLKVGAAYETATRHRFAPPQFGISFWGGPGEEPAVLKIAATYEAATKPSRTAAGVRAAEREIHAQIGMIMVC